MRAIFTKVYGDLRRRLVQTIVVAGIVALAAGVGTLALALINASSAPFDNAFAQNAGADLTVTFNGSRVTADQLRATAQLPDVTNTAGPWPSAFLDIAYGSAKTTLIMIGRPDPIAPLDHLQIAAGRWVTGPGEIVLTRSFAQQSDLRLGDHILSLNRPDTPQLTIVGEVVDIDEGVASLQSPQAAWVMPDQVAKLLPDGTQSDFEMLYRFHHATTQAELDRDTHDLTSALPIGAIGASLSRLEIRQIFTLNSSLILSFLLAFAAFALGAVVIIVANVVAGAVLASTRDVGITRALGFTPGQAVLSFVLQMLLPSAIGCVVGASLGVLGSIPLLNASAASLGLPSSTPDLIGPVLEAVAGILVIVSIAAAIPATRAGRLSPTVALAQGATSSVQHRSRLGEFLQRIGVSRPISFGASDAYARPVRGILTTVAIIVGVATLTFAFGLHATLQHLATDPGLLGGPDATVQRFGSYPDSQLMSTLTAQPETTRIIAYSFAFATIPQTGSPVIVFPMRGDSASVGYHLFTGRWFNKPGEVVIASSLARDANLHVGDNLSVTINGHVLNLRLVGIYFTFNNFGRELRMGWADYLIANPQAQPQSYNVNVRPGTDLRAYTQRIYASAPNFLSVLEHPSIGQSVLQPLDAVLVVLALVLTAIAVAGVLNTVLLTTHERVHDIATLKTLGMSPGQVIMMVCATALLLGIVGGILGIPAGVWLHQTLFSLTGSSVDDPLPQNAYAGAFIPITLPLFAIAGIITALIGAALPARWAARQSVVDALRAE